MIWHVRGRAVARKSQGPIPYLRDELLLSGAFSFPVEDERQGDGDSPEKIRVSGMTHCNYTLVQPVESASCVNHSLSLFIVGKDVLKNVQRMIVKVLEGEVKQAVAGEDINEYLYR